VLNRVSPARVFVPSSQRYYRRKNEVIFGGIESASGPGSSVGIATDYRLNGPGFE
jgi:hypothetical protein